MEDIQTTVLKRIITYIKIHRKMFYVILDLASLPLIYLLIYKTGGIKYVFSHTMYFPIVFAGITLGSGFGLSVGLIAGIMLGPLMPIDVMTGEQQLWYNWVFRLIIYVILGSFSGYQSDLLRKNNKTIQSLLSKNNETNIPNKNSLSSLKESLSNSPQTVITALINNHHNIIDILGSDTYNKVLMTLYDNLISKLDSYTAIVFADSNKFWIIFPYSTVQSDINKISSILKQPLIIDDIPLYVDFAIGFSIAKNPRICANLTTFINSDMSARIAQKKNLSYVVFEDSMSKRKNDFELLGAFNDALTSNQLYLDYQPKIDLKTLKPIGLEALIRWQHPTRGLIMPDSFIPLIEQTQLINTLTDWVLKTALRKVEHFFKLNLRVPISINISAKNLLDPQFETRTNATVDQFHISSSDIEFEITESMLMTNPEEIKSILTNLRIKGHTIAIDDYGVGYSSLAYLSQFPIDIVKIDRFFMSKMDINKSTQQIVKSTINLAHDLGFKVVTEGVEDETTMKLLQEYGCDYAQGYYFSRPLKDEVVDQWYIKNLNN